MELVAIRIFLSRDYCCTRIPIAMAEGVAVSQSEKALSSRDFSRPILRLPPKLPPTESFRSSVHRSSRNHCVRRRELRTSALQFDVQRLIGQLRRVLEKPESEFARR
jgi:hypothetical protein